jgi:hypothetical protein
MQMIPKLHNALPWEYTEELEEHGIISVYEEVGCMSKYLFALRKEVQAVDATIQETNVRLAALGPKVIDFAGAVFMHGFAGDVIIVRNLV